MEINNDIQTLNLVGSAIVQLDLIAPKKLDMVRFRPGMIESLTYLVGYEHVLLILTGLDEHLVASD